MHLRQRYLQLRDRMSQRDVLLITALLLTELMIVLWIFFFGLFAFEALIPNSGMRFSLTTYLFWLLIGTLGMLYVRRKTQLAAFDLPRALSFTGLLLVGLFGSVLLSLSLLRFSLISGSLFFCVYATLGCLLWRLFMHNSR